MSLWKDQYVEPICKDLNLSIVSLLKLSSGEPHVSAELLASYHIKGACKKSYSKTTQGRFLPPTFRVQVPQGQECNKTHQSRIISYVLSVLCNRTFDLPVDISVAGIFWIIEQFESLWWDSQFSTSSSQIDLRDNGFLERSCSRAGIGDLDYSFLISQC